MTTSISQKLFFSRRVESTLTAAALAFTLFSGQTRCAESAELKLQILHEFSSTDGGPWEPWEIVQHENGSFYATSSAGGSNNVGTIFRFTPEAGVTTLVSFSGAIGEYPSGGLIEGADGNFYGTTYQDDTGANGTVFKMTPQGVFTNLHHFDCSLAEGIGPICRLTQAPDGDLYGTTFYGGASGCLGNSAGTVFKVTTNGTFSTLISFNRTNGSNPQCGLIPGPDALYGSTVTGGGPSGDGVGTIFKLTTNGDLITLHTFNDPIDGGSPSGNLLFASDGNFYGTTQGGRNNNNAGSIFKMTPGGLLTILVNFNGTNGSYPHGDLLQASDGIIYGRTINGGPFDAGTLFKLTTNGTFSTILSFDSTNGSGPWPAMVLGRDGNLYGATSTGGSNGGGVAFRLVPQPVITQFGLTNQSVTLTWTSFTNGSYQVEQKPNILGSGWNSVGPQVRASASITTLVIPLQTNSPGFYRVALLR